MTQEREIKLPPLPVYMDSVTPEQFAERVRAWGRAAVEADRQQRGEPAAWSAKSSKRRIERLRRWKRALGTAITHGLPKHARLDAEAAIQEMENAIKYDPPAASAEPADDDPLEGIDWQSPWTPEQVRSYPRAAAAALNRLLSEVYAAPVAAQAEPVSGADGLPPAIFGDEEHVSIPRSLIGAACSAIEHKREGKKTLAELRRYTFGDLSQPSGNAGELPAVPDGMEQLAVNRYRPVPSGVIAYKVVCGDGERSLFSGTKDECYIVARKLTEAFLDGAHVALAAQAQHAISGYTHTVPDDCETLHWRGNILSMNELASVAQPAVGEEIHIHIEGQDVLTLPLASSGMDAPRFVVHVPAQAQPIMPPLTDAMRAVLRNEHCVYDSEDALYVALCDAAQAQPVVNQSLTTEREALAAALKALEAISDEMTVGERYTNAGQYLIDALPTVRAALAQQSAEQPSGNSGELSGQDREDAADMFWNADDPERFGGDNLHDTLVDLADDYGDPDFPLTVRLQCAKRLPDVQAVVTGRNDDGELVYEVIDAARAAKGADHG